MIILVFILWISSCKEEKKTNIDTNETIENISSDLEVDHFNIWVENPKEAKEKLIEIGFTSVPDSLSQNIPRTRNGRQIFQFLQWIFRIDFCLRPK